MDSKHVITVLQKLNDELKNESFLWKNEIESIQFIIDNFKPIQWFLSREQMPPFDGEYYVCGYMHYPCGNVVEFHKIGLCRMNKWVKSDEGEQYTFWTYKLPFPKQQDMEQENSVR